ncbi:hypothetical protein B0H16DRAFT_1453534 [Mycena metata]|uniref:Uncharacterized protein n=1 Tax=Mycena metata TaxID=1033252 RepID=A0AAD7JNR6_9AGAR|nr:hypothetical protein B0H16DRAFT_1453534 [Mycena metata]
MGDDHTLARTCCLPHSLSVTCAHKALTGLLGDHLLSIGRLLHGIGILYLATSESVMPRNVDVVSFLAESMILLPLLVPSYCAMSIGPLMVVAYIKDGYWWAHKISYPWLLPSLNRSLTSMSHLHWDLTPGDTNPIEGSHVQDNQVNATNRTFIEAILLAREYDNNTARVIKASLTSGVLENGNNSLQARYAAAARRQTRNKAKAVERAAADGGKKVRAKLKAAEQESRAKDLEIARLTAMLAAGPSTPRRIASPFPQTNHTLPANLSPVAGPSRLPALNLFPSLPPMTPIAEPRSDFDYQLAMRSDILDATLHRINQLPMYRGKLDSRNRLMYSVGSDDEVLASDPYPISP